MVFRVLLVVCFQLFFSIFSTSYGWEGNPPPSKVTFATNWVAQAEHGGYYQALVDGTYARFGLDVTIVSGGSNINNRILLPLGKIDFFMGANMIQAFSAVERTIPTVVVAAIFQKDPQVLIAHSDQGFNTLEDLKKSDAIMISRENVDTFFQWLKAVYGFKDEQLKPYTFSVAPFLVNKKSVIKGYSTSEPLAIEKQGGFKPKVFLLADYGYDGYSTTIETRQELVENSPELVQKFVDASIVGWYSYLYGDNKAANELIKKRNPEMSDEQIAFSIEKMKQDGIVDSGDALTAGIGAMTDARMKSFFDKMVASKVVKADLDYKKAYTLAFVNKGLALKEMALKPKN